MNASVPDLPLRHRFEMPVDGGHVLSVEDFGPADGLPALVLHGGPGSGTSPTLRLGFDARWRVVCPDQRGSGRSRPRGSIGHNTLDHLVGDIVALRRHLGLERWVVCGGSWGATLAVAYAAADPGAVAALLLRASFLGRRQDIDGFFAGSGLTLEGLAADLHGDDAARRDAAARAWWGWEQQLAAMPTAPAALDGEALALQVDRLRVQAHYLRHGCWLDADPLLDRCARLPRVPTWIVHARDDRVCPPSGATLLHARLPQARLAWVDGAGHDPRHPAMVGATAHALADIAARLGAGVDA